jgi:NAD(P)-dependent dehydrogenase (short-subunit alcohol dehydrogenase family)
MSSSKSRKVLVTGAATSLGFAIAREFVERGDDVAICDISQEALDLARNELPKLHIYRTDMGKSEDIRTFVTRAADRLGGIDVIVNNAGIPGGRGPIEDVSEEDWERTVAVNLSGPFYMIKYATPFLKESGRGSIINISTSSARTGMVNRMPYVVTKSGLSGLTMNVARELGRFGVQCNSVSPGALDNERGRGLIKRLADEKKMTLEEANDEFLKFVSMRTMVSLEEVAAMVHFLASDMGRHISGQNIGVCGNFEWED